MSFISRLLNKSSSSHASGAGPLESSSTTSFPTAFQPMGPHLQRRFARGVHYNMKIVIRGDANVGKSCLLARLQGRDFVEGYSPSDEIRVVSVHWNYKTTDDVIKVEVWDVVDKSRRTMTRPTEPQLDAEWVNVYKGCHGVILLLDMTKAWTLAYVEQELPRVPDGLPVLVLANHRDMAAHRSVTEAQARDVIARSGRPLESTRYAESSMRNGYGLKYIHRFLNLPFLHLQRQSLLAQLKTNEEDMEAVILELDLEEEGEENSYDSLALYRSRYQLQLRAKSEGQPTATVSNSASQQQAPSQATQRLSVKTQSSVANDASPSPPGVAMADDQQPRPAAPPPRLIPGSERLLMELQRAQSQTRPEPAGAPASLATGIATTNQSVLTSIDNFVPPVDDAINDRTGNSERLDQFLDDEDSVLSNQGAAAGQQQADSSDDESAGNPMVAAFAEDIDSDDEEVKNNAIGRFDAADNANLHQDSDSSSADSEPEPAAAPQRPVPAAQPDQDTVDADADDLENFLNDEDD